MKCIDDTVYHGHMLPWWWRTHNRRHEYIDRSLESAEFVICVIFICLPNVFRDGGSKTTSWTDEQIYLG